jgi:hypothetical protein
MTGKRQPARSLPLRRPPPVLHPFDQPAWLRPSPVYVTLKVNTNVPERRTGAEVSLLLASYCRRSSTPFYAPGASAGVLVSPRTI